MPQSPLFNKQKKPLNPIIFRIILLGIAAVFAGISYHLIHQQWQVNHYFLSTNCTVLDKKILSINSDKGGTTYKPVFYVKYQVNGIAYQHWITADIISSSSNFFNSERRELDRYQMDSNYTCWYNPSSPNSVVLERGYEWFSFVFVPVPIILIGLCFVRFKRISQGNPNNPNLNN